jgi:hypothetical protein
VVYAKWLVREPYFGNLTYDVSRRDSTFVATSAIPDMRSSVRFPLHLPLAVRADSREHYTETSDISSGGVLFQADLGVPVGSTIEFTIAMPASIVGTSKDVLVNCVGRVVRCSPQGGPCQVAAVIDEYKFIR